jgi:hypothetical protein
MAPSPPPHASTAPKWASFSSLSRLAITLRHTTLGRTPLDEWSARCRDLYLTKHNTVKRQKSMPPAGFKLTIPASEQLKPMPYTARLLGSAYHGNSKRILHLAAVSRCGKCTAKIVICLHLEALCCLWRHWHCRQIARLHNAPLYDEIIKQFLSSRMRFV